MKKNKIGIISIFLTCVLLFSCLIGPFQTDSFLRLNITENVRADSMDESDELTVEDEIEEFLSQFEQYECIENPAGEQIIVRAVQSAIGCIEYYETIINYSEESDFVLNISVTTEYYDGTIGNEEFIIRPVYNETEDEFYIEIEDALYSVTEIINADLSNARIAIVDDTTAALVVLAAATVIIAYPHVETIVTMIYTTVIKEIIGFFGWIKNLFLTRVVTKTVVTTVVTYQISLWNRSFVLEKVESGEEPPRNDDQYYLAIIMGTCVYFSTEEISMEQAISVLASPIQVLINNNYYQLNTYIMEKEAARDIAVTASSSYGNDRIGAAEHTYHNDNGNKSGTYFKHFHPGFPYIKNTPHSFFGSPQII